MGKRSEENAAKAAHWEQVIGEQEGRGMTIAAFCRERGIAVGKFHWWKRRLREMREGAAGGGFVELVARPAETGYSGVELVVDSGGVSVRLARGFDRETLQVVLATLNAAAG